MTKHAADLVHRVINKDLDAVLEKGTIKEVPLTHLANASKIQSLEKIIVAMLEQVKRPDFDNIVRRLEDE